MDTNDGRRRRAVLESAVETFARTGYRGTSMEAVARAARISRPGLYFLFGSKEALFREATAHVVAQDLTAIAALLAADDPMPERLLAAFDRWAGRYVGPAGHDVSSVVAENPDLVDDDVRGAPARFDDLLRAAVADHLREYEHDHERSTMVAQTLVSVSIGLQHQLDDRGVYRERMRRAIELVLPDAA